MMMTSASAAGPWIGGGVVHGRVVEVVDMAPRTKQPQGRGGKVLVSTWGPAAQRLAHNIDLDTGAVGSIAT